MGRRSERLSRQGTLAHEAGRRGRCYSGGVACLRYFALLRGPRSKARQSGNLEPLRTAALDRVAPDAHADANGAAGLSAARSEISHRSKRGGDEHLDDARLAVASSDSACGCRKSPSYCRAPSASSFRTASISSIWRSAAPPTRSACHRRRALGSRSRAPPRAMPMRRRWRRRPPKPCLRTWSGKFPESAKLLRPRLDADRHSLRERGYVTMCGLWSPHINGLAVPLWSPQYQTYVVVTIGLLSNIYDEMRLHKRRRAQEFSN